MAVGLKLVGGVRYGDDARSIILNTMSSYRGCFILGETLNGTLKGMP